MGYHDHLNISCVPFLQDLIIAYASHERFRVAIAEAESYSSYLAHLKLFGSIYLQLENQRDYGNSCLQERGMNIILHDVPFDFQLSKRSKYIAFRSSYSFASCGTKIFSKYSAYLIGPIQLKCTKELFAGVK